MVPISLCYITVGLKGLAGTNTLAFWAHSQVTKEMNYCNKSARDHIQNTVF
jgi:hypothetical protein